MKNSLFEKKKFINFCNNVLQFHSIFNIGGMKLDHYCFQVSTSSEDQKKGIHGKFEEFLSPKSSKDQQKKRSSPKIEEFLSPKASEDQKKSKNQPALRCRPYSIYWGYADADHS